MHAVDGIHVRPRRTSPVVYAVVILVLLLTGCGGEADEPDGVDPARAETEVETAGASVEAGAGDTDVAVGGSQRPDWLPFWLFLPPDLEITVAFQDEDSGEAAVAGWIRDGDPQKLYDDAWFMVQTGGYIIGEESASGDQESFNADHTGDGSTVRFGVVGQDDGIVQWSMELSDI